MLSSLRTCSYALNWILYFYFVQKIFLRKLTFKDYLIMAIAVILGSYISATSFYLHFIAKNILSFCLFTLICWYLYKKSFQRICIIYIYNYILAIIGEAIVAPIFLQAPSTLTSWFFAYLMHNLILFIEIKIFLIFYNRNIYKLFSQDFSYLLIISLLIVFTIFTSIFINLLSLKYISLSVKEIQYIILFLSCFIFIFFILSISKLKKLYYALKSKAIIQNILNEYKKQCLDITNKDNEQYYQNLRHDIINYIETYQRIYAKDEKHDQNKKQ